MKKKIIYFSLAVVSLVLHSSVAPVLLHSRLEADVVLMMVFAFAVLEGFSAFFGWSIFIGFFFDIVLKEPVGQHALIFMGTLYMTSFLAKRLSTEIRGSGFLILFFLVPVVNVWSMTVQAFVCISQTGYLSDYFLKSRLGVSAFIVQSFYSIIVFALWYFAIRRIKNYFAI